VTVTGYDIWNIATTLKIAPEQFLIWFPAKETSRDGFKLDQTGATFNVALDKVTGEGDHRACIFLLELPGGFSRCGIYPCRPQVCQTYPAYLDGDVVSLRTDVLCPQGSWKLSQLNLNLWRQRLYHFRVEQDIYQILVSRWNRRVDRAGSGRQFHILEYYAFLMNVYPRLAQAMEAVPGSDWYRILEQWGTYRNGGLNPLAEETDGLGDEASAPWLGYRARVRTIIEEFFPSSAEEEQEAQRENASTAPSRSPRVLEGAQAVA
jgi:Fe-S-cluster containining protein